MPANTSTRRIETTAYSFHCSLEYTGSWPVAAEHAPTSRARRSPDFSPTEQFSMSFSTLMRRHRVRATAVLRDRDDEVSSSSSCTARHRLESRPFPHLTLSLAARKLSGCPTADRRLRNTSGRAAAKQGLPALYLSSGSRPSFVRSRDLGSRAGSPGLPAARRSRRASSSAREPALVRDTRSRWKSWSCCWTRAPTRSKSS